MEARLQTMVAQPLVLSNAETGPQQELKNVMTEVMRLMMDAHLPALWSVETD